MERPIPPRVDVALHEVLHKVVQQTNHAVKSGALKTIDTEPQFIEQNGLHFLIQVVANLSNKPKPPANASSDEQPRKPFNPFAPPDVDLYVGHFEEDYMIVLNKFNISPHHFLLVTAQESPQLAGFGEKAIGHFYNLVVEAKGLGFYNCGPLSGASQPHWHTQIIPLGGDGAVKQVPMDLAKFMTRNQDLVHFLDNHADLANTERAFKHLSLAEIHALPFRHVIIPLIDITTGDSLISNLPRSKAHHQLHEAYLKAMARLNLLTGKEALEAAAEKRFPSYNVFLTHEYMLVFPRSKSDYHGIDINGAGLGGSFLLRSTEQMDILRDVRYLDVLGAVGFPW